LIEDCSHTLGADYKHKKLGLFGDFSIISFGRDKAISSLFGGALIVNNTKLINQINENNLKLSKLSKKWTSKQIYYSISSFLIRKLYDFQVGKLIHFLSKKFNFVDTATSKGEKESCEKPIHFNSDISDILANQALFQLKRIGEFNSHRQKSAMFYKNSFEKINSEKIRIINYKNFNVPFLRFPLLVENREELISFMLKNKVILGDWYDTQIAPQGVNYESINFDPASCPNSGQVCKKIINLPTGINISMKDAEKIVKLICQFYAI